MSVLWVEPISEVFAELKSNIAVYPKQRAARALVTDRDGAEYLFHVANNNGASSSILEFTEGLAIWPEIEFPSSRTLTSTTLKTLLQQEGITPQTHPWLVMDVQGSELLVLKGAGDLLDQFSHVTAEAADFESYAGCCKLKDLSDHLADFGFVEVERVAFARHPDGGTYWDVTWARPSIVRRVRHGFASLIGLRV